MSRAQTAAWTADEIIKDNSAKAAHEQSRLIAEMIAPHTPNLTLYPAVYREAILEPFRRAGLARRRAERKKRKKASDAGRIHVGAAYRRIIHIDPIGKHDTHTRELHATKGWRSFRIVR